MSDETQQTPVVLSEKQRAELSEFVAGQMFSNLQFNQVLITLENQCRAQAAKTLDEADDDTLRQILEDFQRVHAENELLGGAVIQEGAAQVPETNPTNFENVPTP